MTYAELFLLLKSAEEHNHSSFNDKVTVLFDNYEYYVDLVESLTSGRLVLAPVQEEEE